MLERHVQEELFRTFAATFVLRCTPESTRAKSTSSSSSNPAAATLIEPAAFTEMISLALNRQNVVGGNDNAITVNVNALAFVAAGRMDVYTTPEEFREASTVWRFGGSFTFGAELPKKDVVGFSGIPDADKLLDAVGWDLRFRVLGDRDPRGEAWADLLDEAALRGQLFAQINGVMGLVVVEGANSPGRNTNTECDVLTPDGSAGGNQRQAGALPH